MGVWKRYNGTSWVAQNEVTTAPSARELGYWQTRAALLDPLAYDAATVTGASDSATVPAGETWYVVEAWQAAVGANTLFHRKPDALGGNVIPVREGEAIATNSNSGAHVLLCRPALVTATDDRYTDNPRGLFYERLYRLESELTHYDVGHSNTGSTSVTTAFPTDFDNGLVIHCSTHDVAWTGLDGTLGAINLNNEISDADPIRFAERITLPFVRTTYPGIKSRGVSLASGTVNVRYVKLPSDW